MTDLQTICREYGTKLPDGVGKTAYRWATRGRQDITEVPISDETGVVATLVALDAGDYVLQHHTHDTYYGIHDGVAQSFVYGVHSRTDCGLDRIPEDICPPSLRDTGVTVLETMSDSGQAPIAKLKEQDNNTQLRYTITD